jgi:hypothetical protein
MPCSQAGVERHVEQWACSRMAAGRKRAAMAAVKGGAWHGSERKGLSRNGREAEGCSRWEQALRGAVRATIYNRQLGHRLGVPVRDHPVSGL